MSLGRVVTRIIPATLLTLQLAYCSGAPSGSPILSADMPLHLEDHLDAATIVGSEVPEDIREPVEWRFDELQPDWRPAKPIEDQWEAIRPVRVDDALRLPLNAKNRVDGPWETLIRSFDFLNRAIGSLLGMIYVDLPDWSLEEWAYVEIRARTQDPIRQVGLLFNYAEENPRFQGFYSVGDRAPLVTDGTVQTYRLSLDWPRMRRWEGPWTRLGIWFTSQTDEDAVTLDILSVRLIPRESEFAMDRAGVRTVDRRLRGETVQDAPYRRTLYMHAPGRIAYRVRVPRSARLDVGLGVLRDDVPVDFRITATPSGGKEETLLEETYADREHWGQRSVDLSHLAGKTVTVALEADADRAETVALWAAPTLTGERDTDKPNIIFYIIDGGGADYMSVYGYNRRTTPSLERIAEEGAVFERAYSNASWTRTSTASFLTSLQHSVLGGLKNGRNPVPSQVLTMAEHMHRAGYQTAEFTSNPQAGRVSNLDRGNDVFREAGVENPSVSSVALHENFWRWREAYPGEPYWVHFQTTDVHSPHAPVPPFAGLFISPERRLIAADNRGNDRDVAYWTAQRDLHDETMAHQDYQLGRLVARLKAAGEWERTLLIVASDHSVTAGSMDYNLLTRDPTPPHVLRQDPATPMLRSGVSRIPLIVVWPGHIAGGQRFNQPVSMIDLLPTILDLADLPMPEVVQGQSLAPLLLGEAGWEPRPVILDEFEVDRDTGEFRGRIEVIDGRWGASLAINGGIREMKFRTYRPREQRPVPMQLYDLWNDPECLHILNEQRPDLVEKYTAFLEAQFEAHMALSQLFTPSESVALTPEQLQTLRTLGYIR